MSPDPASPGLLLYFAAPLTPEAEDLLALDGDSHTSLAQGCLAFCAAG